MKLNKAKRGSRSVKHLKIYFQSLRRLDRALCEPPKPVSRKNLRRSGQSLPGVPRGGLFKQHDEKRPGIHPRISTKCKENASAAIQDAQIVQPRGNQRGVVL
jgi:hypothetical protein